MSDMNNPENKPQAVPFFARYLEGQFREDLSKEEMEAVKGGIIVPIPSITRKYPSDREDWLGVTLKYPSDRENVGGGTIVTQKYPSDQEDI